MSFFFLISFPLHCVYCEVYKRPIGQDEETDLSGRVKELGKMFEGGGPIFPKTATIDKNQGNIKNGKLRHDSSVKHLFIAP